MDSPSSRYFHLPREVWHRILDMLDDINYCDLLHDAFGDLEEFDTQEVDSWTQPFYESFCNYWIHPSVIVTSKDCRDNPRLLSKYYRELHDFSQEVEKRYSIWAYPLCCYNRRSSNINEIGGPYLSLDSLLKYGSEFMFFLTFYYENGTMFYKRFYPRGTFENDSPHSFIFDVSIPCNTATQRVSNRARLGIPDNVVERIYDLDYYRAFNSMSIHIVAKRVFEDGSTDPPINVVAAHSFPTFFIPTQSEEPLANGTGRETIITEELELISHYEHVRTMGLRQYVPFGPLDKNSSAKNLFCAWNFNYIESSSSPGDPDLFVGFAIEEDINIESVQMHVL
jgi:hypothetical protein